MVSRDQRTLTSGAMIPRMGCASHVEADWRLRFGVSCARDSISRCVAPPLCPSLGAPLHLGNGAMAQRDAKAV
eukprot:3067129-Prymnesium_polylepis.1